MTFSFFLFFIDLVLQLLVFGLFKDMWRAGEVDCPTSCSSDTPTSQCKCTCPNLTAWTANSSTAKAKLMNIDYAIFKEGFKKM